jgi:hypothetical protein
MCFIGFNFNDPSKRDLSCTIDGKYPIEKKINVVKSKNIPEDTVALVSDGEVVRAITNIKLSEKPKPKCDSEIFCVCDTQEAICEGCPNTPQDLDIILAKVIDGSE